MKMTLPIPASARARQTMRVLLSYYMTNGFTAALGLLVISGLAHLWLGELAAAAASVGVVVCIPPDQAAPTRRKIAQLLPAAVLGLPLFAAVQALHGKPLYLGLLLVPATFGAFLAGAWGKRGLPIVVSIMFAMIFSMASPVHEHGASLLQSSLYFALGAGAYLLWSTLANALLNQRYRVQMLAETLLTLAELIRLQAQQFTPEDEQPRKGTELIGQLLQRQAALADQLQAARDLLLESPRTLRRQQLAGMLMMVLELRDHLLASELDLDAMREHPSHPAVLGVLNQVMGRLATQVEQVADALLVGAEPERFDSLRDELVALAPEEARNASLDPNVLTPAMLTRSLVRRVGHVNDEVHRLVSLSRGEREPDLVAVRAAWHMFVSPTTWTWKPFLALWRWNAPPLRHAIRATLAIGTAYAVSLVLPWGSHDYWILLTIVVVLRGSLAQTLERRNSRVAGTLIGCLIAGVLLSAHLPMLMVLLVLTVAQAIAHAFAVKRYLVTAVAATVLGLVQAHLLNAGVSPVFDVVERLADTLLGVVFAWGFSYFLPSWERHLIPSLVQRTLNAQARHAKVALGLGQLQAIDNEPEIEWRLARREVYDSLSALVQATQRSLSEPRAVRPPLKPLGRMLAHNYQLLAQLTAVKTLLLTRRGQSGTEALRGPLVRAKVAIQNALMQQTSPVPDEVLPEGVQPNPWALRRLELATNIAERVREDAEQILSQASGNT